MIFAKLFRKKKFKAKIKKGNYEPTIIFKPPQKKLIKKGSRRLSIPRSVKNVLLGFVFLAIIIGLFALVIYFINLDAFTVKKFQILGNESITENKITFVLKEFETKSIWLINTGDINESLHKSFFTIESLEITKFLPDKIFINIKEREPTLIYVNIAGVYLVDKNAKIIEIIFEQKINTSENRVLIARGLGDPNGVYIKEQMLLDFIANRNISNLPDQEQNKIIEQEFDFQAIPLSEKEKVLDRIQKQALAEIDAIIQKNRDMLKDSQYNNLPVVNAYENNAYGLDKQIDIEKLNLTKDIDIYFQNKEEKIKMIVWQGETLVQVSLDNGKILIFGINKNYTQQLSDYAIMTEHLKIQGRDFTIMDLSAKKISVK